MRLTTIFDLDPAIAPARVLERVPARAELLRAVRKFGFNSTSYVLLEGHKRYFTVPHSEGFIAYQKSAGVAVIGGDPICAPENAGWLLREFRRAQARRPVCAYQVSPHLLPAFRQAGFDCVQIGNEAVFNLDKFTLAGGDMELVRAATNKARRSGVVVREHDPFAPGPENARLTHDIRAISAAWLAQHGSEEMGFLLGGLGLWQRSDKRYFVARADGGEGRVEGFVVCEPIYGRHGYYLDVTRRRADAVRGTMELLTTEIFRQLRGEGYHLASMGLAPLAHLDDPDLRHHPRYARVMQFVYQNVNASYDFKSLYRYKAKYRPHAWERRYLCFTPRLSPRLLYATMNVRASFSLRNLLREQATRAANPIGWKGTLASWKHKAALAGGLCAALWFSA